MLAVAAARTKATMMAPTEVARPAALPYAQQESLPTLAFRIGLLCGVTDGRRGRSDGNAGQDRLGETRFDYRPRKPSCTDIEFTRSVYA